SAPLFVGKPMLKFRWLNVLYVSARNCREKRSLIFVFLKMDIFQTLSPGVLTVFLPALASAPNCAWTKRALGSTATYPTRWASSTAVCPELQKNAPEESAATIEVAPPGPELQTALTMVPVLAIPLGLKIVRSPA